MLEHDDGALDPNLDWKERTLMNNATENHRSPQEITTAAHFDGIQR